MERFGASPLTKCFFVMLAFLPFIATLRAMSDPRFEKQSHSILSVYALLCSFGAVGVRTFVVEWEMVLLAPTIVIITMLSIATYGFRLNFIHATTICSAIGVTWILMSVPYVPESKVYTLATFVIAVCCVFIHMIFLSIASYENEKFYRIQYLADKEIKKNQMKLTNQLKIIAKTYTKTALSLDSPLERSALVIRGVMADSQLSSQHLMSLGQVLSLLSSTNLFTPDFEALVGESLDKQQQAWLFSEIAARKRGEITQSIVKPRRKSFGTLPRNTNTPPALSMQDLSRNEKGLGGNYPPVLDSVVKLLYEHNLYDWDIFRFANVTENNPLFVLSHHLFSVSNFFETFSIPREKFSKFLCKIESGYHSDLPCTNLLTKITIQFMLLMFCIVFRIWPIWRMPAKLLLIWNCLHFILQRLFMVSTFFI